MTPEQLRRAKNCAKEHDLCDDVNCFASEDTWVCIFARALLAEIAAREAAEKEVERLKLDIDAWVSMEKRIPLRLTVKHDAFGDMTAFEFFEMLRARGDSMEDASHAVLGTLRRCDGPTQYECELRDEVEKWKAKFEQMRAWRDDSSKDAKHHYVQEGIFESGWEHEKKRADKGAVEIKALKQELAIVKSEFARSVEAFTSLKSDVAAYRGALESIASLKVDRGERHIDPEFWLSQTHEECAEVLATDTEIARITLSRPSPSTEVKE